MSRKTDKSAVAAEAFDDRSARGIVRVVLKESRIVIVDSDQMRSVRARRVDQDDPLASEYARSN